MATFVFRRRWAFENCWTPYWILIDGKVSGRIWTGQTGSVSVPNGRHSVRIDNGIFKSEARSVHASDEHDLLFEFGPREKAPPQGFITGSIWFMKVIRDDAFFENYISLSVTKLPPNNSFKPKPLRGSA